jgi:uncharacterized damage-inducible protein DinB
MSIRLFYDRYAQYNQRIVEVIGTLTPEQLALRPSADHWPIWGLVGHMAGSRAYWLCDILGEPGIESTPFADAEVGWEDEPDRPRSAEELVGALESTYAIIDGVLDRWTVEDLARVVERPFAGVVQLHSRSSILQRLLTHDAYHVGEIGQLLGTSDLEAPYIWRPIDS